MFGFLARLFRPRSVMHPELAALDTRLTALLPAVYHGCLTNVAPNSMGSASVKYGPDGKVAWDDIWTTFCDLALAGGPPHRGRLLEPVSPVAVAADLERYRAVLAEIERAVRLTTLLPTVPVEEPGWAGVMCESEAMAAWVRTAVVAENVSCRRRGAVLHLPAGPGFRVEKEIKNVVASLAKACHYWDGHLSAGQRAAVEQHFVGWEPATRDDAEYSAAVELVVGRLRPIGLPIDAARYVGWVGIEVGEESAAVWLLRATVANGVSARREGGTLYLPVGATADEDLPERTARAFVGAWRLWKLSRL